MFHSHSSFWCRSATSYLILQCSIYFISSTRSSFYTSYFFLFSKLILNLFKMYTKDAKNLSESNIANLNFKGTCLVILRKISIALLRSHHESTRGHTAIYSFRRKFFFLISFLIFIFLLEVTNFCSERKFSTTFWNWWHYGNI